MQVSLENVGGLERRLTVKFPSADLDGRVRERMLDLGRNVRLKGFRPGKVPSKVIEQRFGAQVRGEAFSEIVSSTLQKALGEQQLRPVAAPSINTSGQAENGEIAYTATFEVFPQLPAVDASALNIERIDASVSDADIDNMIETLCKQRTRLQRVERAAVSGDHVGFEYHTQTADLRLPAEGMDRGSSILGSGTLLAEIDAALLGKAAGAELELDVAFPAEFRNEHLAGKLARMHLHVLTVQEPVLPVLDAEFVRQFGIDSGEIADFRREVRANLERELGAAVTARLKGEVAEKLAAAHPDVSVPRAMLEAETHALARMGLAQDAQPSPERIESVRAPARIRVIAALLMGEIARREGLQPDAQRVATLMASIASTYEDPQQVIELYQRDQQLLANLRTRVLEDQVAEWVAQHAQTTVRSMSFDELLRPGRHD